MIENNYLNSMMASILMRPEAYFWYEAGANENTVIRNNTFHNCILGGGEQAMLFISPRFAKNFDKSGWIDKMLYLRIIRFIHLITNNPCNVCEWFGYS